MTDSPVCRNGFCRACAFTWKEPPSIMAPCLLGGGLDHFKLLIYLGFQA